jgi:hypothetical protein
MRAKTRQLAQDMVKRCSSLEFGAPRVV